MATESEGCGLVHTLWHKASLLSTQEIAEPSCSTAFYINMSLGDHK